MNCFLFEDCYGPGPLWIVEQAADMDLLAYFYDPGSPADTASAYCTEIPDLERNFSAVTLGRVSQEWNLQPYPFDFLNQVDPALGRWHGSLPIWNRGIFHVMRPWEGFILQLKGFSSTWEWNLQPFFFGPG